MKGVTIWHLFKISLSTLRLYFKYTQEAHPIRAKQIHVYNCTSLLNRIMSLIKPLLKPEVAARFHFHEPDSDTLFEFVPRDMLPEGEFRKFICLNNSSLKCVSSHRIWWNCRPNIRNEKTLD